MIGRIHDSIRSVCVLRVVQHTSNVMDKQRVEYVGDLLLVGKLESTIEWNPVDKLAAEDNIVIQATYQTPLRCIGPIFTTCLIFSDLRIPSLLPLVMPATFKSLVPLMK